MSGRHILGSVVAASAVAVLITAFGTPPAAAQDDADGPATDATTTTATPSGGETLQGRLRSDGEPVAGVEISAESDGATVGSATTGRDGAWAISLPGPGTYDLVLDTATLPEGVDLRDAERARFEVNVRSGQIRNVLFPLGERAAGSSESDVDQFIKLLAIGVKIGLLVAMASIGLSLIYGVTNLVNFAHGELVTLGALTAFFFNAAGGGPGIHVIPATILAVIIGGLVGLAMERGMFAPLRRRHTEGVALIVFTIGLSILIRHLFLIAFGGQPRPYTDYTVQRAFDVGPVALPAKDYVISIVGVLVLVAVGVLLQKTRVGTGMRAVADNRDLAEASGIDVNAIIRFTWVLAGALAALGGALLGLTESVSWDMGFRLLLFMFAAVVVGGLGTAYGAMVGGLLVGVVSQVSTFWVPIEFKDAIALGVLILVLIARPQGILGLRERVG